MVTWQTAAQLEAVEIYTQSRLALYSSLVLRNMLRQLNGDSIFFPFREFMSINWSRTELTIDALIPYDFNVYNGNRLNLLDCVFDYNAPANTLPAQDAESILSGSRYFEPVFPFSSELYSQLLLYSATNIELFILNNVSNPVVQPIDPTRVLIAANDDNFASGSNTVGLIDISLRLPFNYVEYQCSGNIYAGLDTIIVSSDPGCPP